jgi:tetratricopeptide (TPR) repeat protein
MRKFKEVMISLLAILIIAGAGVGMYKYLKNKPHNDLAKRMAELSPRGGPPETIEGLRAAIALYEAQIELNIKEGAQTGAYWKILAIRLADRKLYRDALDAIERAIYFNAEDPALFYLTGDYASVVAASAVGFSGNATTERTQYQNLAESAYLRAIQIDPVYTKPRLGLGILYVFDLNRPLDAIPHLQKYMELSPSDVKGMFVLARAYYMTSAFDDAVELYDRIIARTKDPKIKAEAQNNKEIIRKLIYG